MIKLWDLLQDGNIEWFNLIWTKICKIHRPSVIWYFLCSNIPLFLSNDKNKSFDVKLETFLKHHSKKKSGLIYGVPPSVYGNILLFLTPRERFYGLREVSYTLRMPWVENSSLMMQGLRNWSLLMANELTRDEKIAALREIWGDEEILRRMIFDKRMIPKWERDAIVKEYIKTHGDTLNASSDCKLAQAVPVMKKKEFRPLNDLSEGLLKHVLRFGNLSSFFHLLNSNWYFHDTMSRGKFFYQLPAFHHLQTRDHSYINWSPAVSSFHFYQFSKLMSEDYIIQVPDERIMPRFTGKYIVGFYGNHGHIADNLNHLRFAVLFNHLGFQRSIYRFPTQNYFVVTNNKLPGKQTFPNYVTNGRIFIGADCGIGLHNFYRMIVGIKQKIIMLLQGTVYYEPLIGVLDDGTNYAQSCDKHIVIVSRPATDPLEQFMNISSHPWCASRIRKLSILFHWVDLGNFDLFTRRILDSQICQSLQEITLFGYHDLRRLYKIPPNEQFNFRNHFNEFLTWIEKSWIRVQSHPLISSFKMCIYIKDSWDIDSEKGDIFDIRDQKTLSDVKYHTQLWRSLYNGTHDNALVAPVSCVLTEFSDIMQCLTL